MKHIISVPLKTIYEIINKFFNDDTTYYAASLSFFTIFSLLPILALLIAVISYLDLTASYLDIFLSYIMDILNPVKSEQFKTFIDSFLSNANKLGSIGFFYMIFVFGMFFKDYEYIVSKIHNSRRRALYKAVIFYVGSLFLLPTLFIIFIFVISFVGDSIGIKILSFLFAWMLVFLLFKLATAKVIDTKASLVSSFATITTLSITKNLFVYYVIYNKTYTTIYGSFSTMLFFFLWIYVSWVIYLYGVKFCAELNEKFKIQGMQ
jgi:membrane protein